MTKEIVIAAYDKPTNWLINLNSDIKKTIYRKGNALSLADNEILIEPNVGRCVHTFFSHIYHNYDNLSDYTFFVQDYPFDHWGNLIDITNKASLIIGGYFGFHNNTLGSTWNMPQSKQFDNGNVLVCLSNGHPQDTNHKIDINKYWNLLFSSPEFPPPLYEFIPGGHFVITKEHVHIRRKEFYKKIIDLLEEDITAPWMIERLECYIFNPKYKTKL